jgi:hypothetical protein
MIVRATKKSFFLRGDVVVFLSVLFYIGSFSHRDCRGACECTALLSAHVLLLLYILCMVFLTADWILRRHKLLCNVPLQCQMWKKGELSRREKKSLQKKKLFKKWKKPRGWFPYNTIVCLLICLGTAMRIIITRGENRYCTHVYKRRMKAKNKATSKYRSPAATPDHSMDCVGRSYYCVSSFSLSPSVFL